MIIADSNLGKLTPTGLMAFFFLSCLCACHPESDLQRHQRQNPAAALWDFMGPENFTNTSAKPFLWNV